MTKTAFEHRGAEQTLKVSIRSGRTGQGCRVQGVIWDPRSAKDTTRAGWRRNRLQRPAVHLGVGPEVSILETDRGFLAEAIRSSRGGSSVEKDVQVAPLAPTFTTRRQAWRGPNCTTLSRNRVRHRCTDIPDQIEFSWTAVF